MRTAPRIVAVGEPAEAGLRDSVIAALRHCGCSVDALDLGPWSPALLASAAFRLPRLGAGFRHMFRMQVDMLAERCSADLVLVFKGPLLNGRSIDYLRSRFESPVVCWNPDSPFDSAVSNRGAGIPGAIDAYDAYITWSDSLAEELSGIATRVMVIPFAWDPEVMQPVAGRGEAAGRIVFIGTGTAERCANLERIAHLRPIIFGTRWPRIEGIEIRHPVKADQFCEVVGEAKWNLNFLRPQNAKSHNMRSFELVGAGGTQVAPQTIDHRQFLGRDSRTILFKGQDDLEAILRSDPHELPDRCEDVLNGHTYRDRAERMLVELGLA